MISPQDPDGVEPLLEPETHLAVVPFREALIADGIPVTSFAVDDVPGEVKRLRALGVSFTQDVLQIGPVTTGVFDDTCGNLIQVASQE